MASDVPAIGPEKPLRTWRQIGDFVGRDERTVKRWEATRGLPVHRVPGGGSTAVFAYPTELTRWLGIDQQAPPSATTPVAAEPLTDTMPEAATILPGKASLLTRFGAMIGAAIGKRLLIGFLGAAGLLWMAGDAVRISMASANQAATAGVDVEARDLYLRGRLSWAQRTPASLTKAIDLFGSAVSRDPRMTEAYVGLADAWLLRREFAAVPETEAWNRADAAVTAALAIDPNNAGAIRARAFIDFWWEHRREAGLAGFSRAVVLEPTDAQSHHWYATALGTTGAHEQALAEIEAARQLDPANPAILADRGLLLFQAGRADQAVAALKEVIATSPTQSDAHSYLSDALFINGDIAGFIHEGRLAAQLRGDQKRVAFFNGVESAFNRNGTPHLAINLARLTKAGLQNGSLSPYNAARLLAMAGRRDDAYAVLGSAAARIDPSVAASGVDPLLRIAAAK